MANAADTLIVAGPAFQQIALDDALVTPNGGSQAALKTLLAGGTVTTGGTIAGPVTLTGTLTNSGTVAGGALAGPITFTGTFTNSGTVTGGAITATTLRATGNLFANATSLGFYGTTGIIQQTGVSVTAAGIHAALVNLGLFTA
jgi:subtilase-type serine protease